MQKTLNKIKEVILDILLPKKCLGCKKEGSYICDKCEIFLSEADNNITGLVSIWEYEGIIKKSLQYIKDEGQHHIIDELIEKALAVMLRDPDRFKEFLTFLAKPDTYITYVPRHKEKQRSFNQAELMARKIGQITNKEVIPLLEKIKDNNSQYNFKSSFSPQNVVLIDDIYATGATMRKCCQALKGSGVKNIWSFVLARNFNI